jgi:hypothetical protein
MGRVIESVNVGTYKNNNSRQKCNKSSVVRCGVTRYEM